MVIHRKPGVKTLKSSTLAGFLLVSNRWLQNKGIEISYNCFSELRAVV
jgi:hypothetical protein